MVIAIIAVLAAMLLPVLGKARERAQLAACTNQLKNLALSSTMYTDDNDGQLMLMGRFSGMYYGDYNYDATVNTFLPFYDLYLEGNLNANGQTPTGSVRFYTSQSILCPSNPRRLADGRYNNFRLPYAMVAGAVLDRPVTIEQEMQMFRTAVQKGRLAGDSPVWWLDRANYSSLGNNGGLAETNHKANSIPTGGNAAHLDGHVTWNPFVGTGSTKQEGVMWAHGGNNHVGLPTNTVYVRSDGTLNLSTSDLGANMWANGITAASQYR